jgi:hypothetical protein
LLCCGEEGDVIQLQIYFESTAAAFAARSDWPCIRAYKGLRYLTDRQLPNKQSVFFSSFFKKAKIQIKFFGHESCRMMLQSSDNVLRTRARNLLGCILRDEKYSTIQPTAHSGFRNDLFIILVDFRRDM